ncbi:STAS domain-containing protein [Actinomycetospora cinnamomea]|uniref:Anti-anti-sigma regulatory factor n=1 Tax=Actinomycetospora cinnamomea TaxID=663609 RepID=A0A2U1F7I7_9PSEU|nr:STAS domain-containing protein [Actinomycetospora cinnamomea]PVZ08138.1 anti-anti-sigma regulatory factor [Actinomycetospora cinnamomea]
MDVEATPAEAVETGNLEQRRRVATAEAVDEALAGARSGRPVVAVRRFGEGALVVALGGHVDHATVRHVEAVLRNLHHLASRHLVVDLTAVRRCDVGLARVLGHARIRCLVDDAAVTVQNLPDELRGEYGHQIGRPASTP